MDYKYIGYLLIIVGLLQISVGFVDKDRINQLKLAQLPQSCHIGNDPNTCPIIKDSVDWHIVVLWISSALVIAIGFYFAFIAKFENIRAKQDKIVNQAKRFVARKRKDDRFEILLSGLDEAEQKVMRAVKEQDGIKQNTLYIRTELSKTKLSLVLNDLQKKNLIRKVPEGKTNRIYLKRAV